MFHEISNAVVDFDRTRHFVPQIDVVCVRVLPRRRSAVVKAPWHFRGHARAGAAERLGALRCAHDVVARTETFGFSRRRLGGRDVVVCPSIVAAAGSSESFV